MPYQDFMAVEKNYRAFLPHSFLFAYISLIYIVYNIEKDLGRYTSVK